MNNHSRSQSLDASTLVSLLNELAVLSEAAKNVREKLLKIIPVQYGSDLWWEKSDKEAMEEIKAGRGISFNNIKELKQYLGA
ncbi:hypothetical protein HY946_00200 [Candidatus Gottesmanbacteria bacterium]|nr:hypothetical protein [Candidatus Gottesmanbacteria bacterium]